MIARILVGLISLYQRRGGGQRLLVECNYTPSCSEYAKTAIERFGVRAGVGLAIARIRHCNGETESISFTIRSGIPSRTSAPCSIRFSLNRENRIRDAVGELPSETRKQYYQL